MISKSRFRCALVIAALSLGFVVTMSTQAQNVSFTLTPVGPQGLGSGFLFRYFYTATPCGYPTHLFLGNWFQSSDQGDTWTPMLSRYQGIAGQVIEDRNDPQTEYMSCHPGPFAVSNDGGQSWQVISTPFDGNNRGWSLAQDAAGVLYLQASRDGTTFYLYTSSDGGATWNQVSVKHGRNKLRDGSMVFPMWADPVTPGMLYAFHASHNNSAFLVTKDGGKNWKRRERGMPHRPNGRLPKAFNPSCFAQSSVPPYSIYALGNLKQGAYYSDDRGKHWHNIRTMSGMMGYFRDGSLHVKPGTNDTLWALAAENGTGYSRLAESRDKGKTWTIRGTLLPSEGWTQDQLCGWECPALVPDYAAYNLMVTQNGNILLNKPPQGLLLSTDGGTTFQVHNAGASGWSFDQLYRATDGTIYASSHDPYLWKSSDNGRSWTLCDWAPYISVRERSDGAIVGPDWGGELWSYNQGKLDMVSTGPQGRGGNPVMELVGSGSAQRIILGGCQGYASFFQSDDMGSTWTALGTVPGLTGLTELFADPRNANNLIVAGWNGNPGCGPYDSPYDSLAGGIYYSSDGGATWTAALDGNTIGGVTCLFRDKNNPDILVASAMGYAQFPGAQGGIFVSMDGGKSWQKRDDGLPSFVTSNDDPQISAVVSPPDGQTLYAAVQLNGGIYRSDDLGLTWTKIADLPMPMPEHYIQNHLCDLTIRRTAVTQILPLNDGTGDLLIATMGQGLFIGEPSAPDPVP